MTATTSDSKPQGGVEGDSSTTIETSDLIGEAEGTTRTAEDGEHSTFEADRELDEAIFRAMVDKYRNTRNDHKDKDQPSTSTQAQSNAQFLHAARDGDIHTLRNTQDKANPTAINESSETALHLACRYGHLDIVKELLKHEKHKETIEARDNDAWTPLLSACSGDHAETLGILKALFEFSKPDITVESNWNFTALHLACIHSSPGVIEYLLERGANAKAQDKDGDTPLALACQYKTKASIEVLLKRDAGVNISGEHDSTPLTVACQFQSAEVVQLLLEIGADYNAADMDGDTPLILASRYGTAKMVKAILDYQPDAQAHRPPLCWDHKNEKGEDALKRAMSNKSKREDIVPLLLYKGLQLDPKDALDLFSREISETPPGTAPQQSVWLNMVQSMLKAYASPPDESLRQAIKSLMVFSSNEEKVSAIIEAQNIEQFDFLWALTEELNISKDVCGLIWFLSQRESTYRAVELYVRIIIQKQEREDSLAGLTWSSAVQFPRSRLQLSAYFGEHNLVWYLLKKSQPVDENDITSALEIAKARKPTRQTKDKKGTASSESGEEDKLASRQLDHAKSSKKQKVDGHPKRYEYTINILNNAARLVTIPKKQLMRPRRSDIEGKEDLLRNNAATIVSLYERDGQIDLFRSSPSVFDLVYGNEGDRVIDVMEMAKSTFDGMTSTKLNEGMPKQELQMRWIHLPANVMDWMEHLTLRIYDEKVGDDGEPEDNREPQGDKKSKDNKSLMSFMDLAQRSQNELPTDKSNIKFMKPICLREVDGAQDKSQATADTAQEENKGVPRLALYTPYVTFGYCYSKAAKASNPKCTELPNTYKGRILHGPRSLDRFYYNAMLPSDMDERDKTQVVTRGLLDIAMGVSPEEDCEKWPYLTVDQLWVWVIDKETIITSSTHREDEFDNLLINKVWENLLQARQDGFREKLPTKVTEMSHFLVSTCVDFMNNLTWEGVCGKGDERISEDARLKPIISWYADSINEVAAKEKKLFQSFTERTTKAEDESKKVTNVAARHQDAIQRATHDNASDPKYKSLENIKRDIEDWEAINNAAKLLDEVKDIRDELVILHSLVAQQERVWVGLMGPDPDSHDARSPSFIVHELDAMIKTTDTIQKSIKNLLNLEENSIDIKESMMSRDLVDESAKQGKDLVSLAKSSTDQNESLLELARKADAQNDQLVELAGFAKAQSAQMVELAKSADEQSVHLVALAAEANKQSKDNAKQGKILFAFTIVTVVFTPLSFMTSILALNTTISRHNDEGELEWEPGMMYGIIFGVSAICVAPFMLYALLDKMRSRLQFVVAPLSSFWDCIRLVDLGDVTSIGEDNKSGSRRDLASIAEEGRSEGNSTPAPLNPQ